MLEGKKDWFGRQSKPFLSLTSVTDKSPDLVRAGALDLSSKNKIVG